MKMINVADVMREDSKMRAASYLPIGTTEIEIYKNAMKSMNIKQRVEMS